MTYPDLTDKDFADLLAHREFGDEPDYPEPCWDDLIEEEDE